MPTAASRPLLAVVVGLALLSGCSGGPGADDASSEYYTESSRTASSIASLDKEAYAEDGIIVTPAPTTVENSPDAYTYAWEQSTAPPWDETAPAIDLSCQAKTADGPDGYAYGVYVCSPKGNQRSIDAMQAVLDSMSISGS